MFISCQTLPRVAAEYVSEVLIPKMPSSIGQFGLGFILPYLNNAIQQRVNEYMPTMKMLGIVDENQKIDLDKAKEAALAGLDRSGGKIHIANYAADKDDVMALYGIAQRYATHE